MTSKDTQQPAIPAPNNTAAPAVTSYASAAGAVKKPSSTPVVATGSNPPVVAAGSSAHAPNHAKSSSVSPVNGRQNNIMPAVPVPAVAHGTSTVNGQPDHNRKSSVTIGTNGPNYSTNGASTGAKSNIQFGYQDSPAASHSTPQLPSAQVAIPPTNRVVEPRAEPTPIPQPSASGGRPPSGAATSGSTLAFGSFEDTQSHNRNPSSHDPSNLGLQHTPHIRRNSNVSDISNHAGPQAGGMGRGSFSGGSRGGRAHGGGYNNSVGGYPPNFRNQQGNQGRGGMSQNYPNNGRPHYGAPPPQQSRSPAIASAVPHSVPNMAPNMAAGPPPYYFPGHVAPNQGYYQPQYDPRNNMQHMAPMPMQGYPAYPGMHPGGSPMNHYQQPVYQPAPYPGPQQMSRSNSQISEPRPASSAGQSQVPIAQGTSQPQPGQVKPPMVQSYVRPKKSAAITIKNEAGETVDLRSLKPPASPASASHQSRTPPVVSSTPTPPPKSSTPKSFSSAHGRTDSTSNSKTAEEKRNEFREKITQTATGDKDKEEDAAKASTEKAAPEPQPAETAPPVEAKTPATVKENVDAKETPEGTKQADAPAPAPQASDKPTEPTEEDLEAIIREMEEADARREKEEEERQKKKQAEAAEKKKAEEAARLTNAAENDRKLREQEAEMERLEDEKQRKREAAAAQAVPTESAAELLRKKSVPTDATPKEASSSSSEVTGKLASLSLNDKSASTSGAKGSPSGRAPKPQALNLGTLSSLAVEPAQPSAALQSLKTARLLDVINADIYPEGIKSPNPALNAAVTKKGTSFKYDPVFLMQFKSVFTEQPNEGFHQQVKTLIGDGDGGRSASNRSGGGPGRQNTRGSTSGFQMGAMGGFTAGGTSTLPPGSTSSQRFEMSNKAMAGRTGSGLSLGNFQRPGGAFAGGSSMSRTPSSNMGSMPHSSRQTSRRNASKPNTVNAKAEAQAAKNMPLTQGMKIDQLQISTSGWKPTSVFKGASSNLAGGSDLMEPAMVQRKVKAALNKMTPENFDRISDQILEIAAQSVKETDGRTLRQVIQLTFEKATDEAHWASMYAKFCKKMLETMSPDIRDESIKDRNGNVVSGGALFRKYLLNRCQEEFERGWKVQLPEPKEGEDQKSAAAALLSDEYYQAAAAKRRGLGLVQFIGELYKLGMLTERIMHECVRKLVDYSGIPDEAEVESLCKLLRTIGGNLDAAEKGKPMMDAYFQRIQGMMELPGLPSRLQFMLMDVVDLRKANWVSKEANKGPKTLEEVRAEAEALAAQKAAEAARSNQRGGGGRAQLGRGDARHMPGGFPQPTPNQVGIDDLRRLKGGASRPSSGNLTLGPMSMLNSRSNSGRRLGPGGSLSRGADDSGASSRTGTPPVRETPTSTNSFGLLATMDSDHPGSPPSTAASPALAKATPETSTVTEKEGN